jgi:hypothetical protein
MCRGVIATDVLTSQDQQGLPCMAIPDSLAITVPLAASQLNSILEPLGLVGIAHASADMQLALFLAFEKQKGASTKNSCHDGVSKMLLAEHLSNHGFT